MPKLNLEGKKSGRLNIVSFSHTDKGTTYWNCICECGNKTIVRTTSISHGRTKSCGCLRKETAKLQASKIIHKKLLPGEAGKNKLCNSYMKHANRRNLEFLLSKEEFVTLTQSNCFYCGQEPNQLSDAQGYNGTYVYNGIDRINNASGYVLENCIPCCWFCNCSKRKLSQAEFFKKIKKLYLHLQEKKYV